MFGTDFIVEAHSGRVSIESFCVEHGRWSQRGQESASGFSSSSNYAPSNAIKLAAKQSRDQSAVWSSVSREQQKLSKTIGAPVESADSATSLELTLGNEMVQQDRTEYVKALAGITSGQTDVVGAVVAINGRLSSADVYGSHDLFQRLWARLLDSSAIEALASTGDTESATATAPTLNDVKNFVSESRGTRPEDRTVTRRVKMVIRDMDKHVRFETLDAKNNGSCIHINCLRKDAAPEGGKTRPGNRNSIGPEYQQRIGE